MEHFSYFPIDLLEIKYFFVEIHKIIILLIQVLVIMLQNALILKMNILIYHKNLITKRIFLFCNFIWKLLPTYMKRSISLRSNATIHPNYTKLYGEMRFIYQLLQQIRNNFSNSHDKGCEFRIYDSYTVSKLI